MSSRHISLRLKPDEDLYQSLVDCVEKYHITAGAIITCVGSLRQANIRLSCRENPSSFHQKMEILCLSGTLSPDGCHLHICLADGDGRTIGGHLLGDSLVNTTAEIVICTLDDTLFQRRQDDKTGYRELEIQPLA